MTNITTSNRDLDGRENDNTRVSSLSSSSSSSFSINEAIALQTSRLLEAYGADAIDCLQSLAALLKERLEIDNSDGIDKDDKHTSKQNDGSVFDFMKIDLQSVVLQTIQMEEDQSSSSSQEEMEPLMEAAMKVLHYWALLQQMEDTSMTSATTSTSTTPSTSSSTLSSSPSTLLFLLDTICEIMTKYPHNASLQESACVTLSKQSALLPFNGTDDVATNDITTSTSTSISTLHPSTHTQVQRILFPILQAMNWHKFHAVLWNAGMIVLTRLLAKASSSSSSSIQDLKERQNQAMTLLDLTGGLDIFFQALKRQPNTSSSTNKGIQMELKVHVCEALAALCLNHPTNQALIARHHPGFTNVLDTMKLYAYHLPLQQSLLQLLASLSYGNESKLILLTKGGLDGILTSLKENPMNPHIQATGCRAIANIFAGTSPEIRHAKGSLCIKPSLRAMRMHPPPSKLLPDGNEQNYNNHTYDNFDDESYNSSTTKSNIENDNDEILAAQIHFYGCAALRNLSKVHSKTIVQAGGIATLLVTIKEYQRRSAVQEQAWGTIYLLLKHGHQSDEISLSLCTEGGLELLLETLHQYSSHVRIQLVGLGCLASLSSMTSLQERILSEKTLDYVLAALYRFHKLNITQQLSPPSMELLQHGCRILAHVSKDNPDFQLAVIGKNGINVSVMVLQHSQAHIGVQLAALETLCNVARNSDNHFHLEGGSKSLIPTLLPILSKQRSHLELSTCSFELLSHLATISTMQSEIVSERGVELVVEILKDHVEQHKRYKNDGDSDGQEASSSSYSNCFKHGVTFLFQIALANHDATLWMKRHDVIPWLQKDVEGQFPRRSPARETVCDLIHHLQSARVFLAKFGRLGARRRAG